MNTSMKLKLAWVFAVLLALLMGGAFLYFNFSDPGPINQANFAKIKKGLTEKDVESILGGPCTFILEANIARQQETEKIWAKDRRFITVFFDVKGLVVAASFKQPSLLQKWFGR